MTVREIARMTSMDPWFLNQMKQITGELKAVTAVGFHAATADDLRAVKRMGVSDERLATEWKLDSADRVRKLRAKLGVKPVFKLVDTCAAEFESYTPYLYSCYDEEDEAAPTARRKIIILGSGPNRIGQGLSSTTAAATRRLRCARTATRPSW